MIGITQLVPILHIWVGLMALEITKRTVEPPTDDGSMTEISTVLGGLVITSITGAMLMAAAIVLGTIASFFFRDRPRQSDVTG